MSLLQKIGYIIVIICFGAWLYLWYSGQSNNASLITGAISFVSLLLSVFNPFERKAKGTGRRDDYYWNDNSGDDYTKEVFRSIALGIAFVLCIASVGLAVYPKLRSLMDTTNTSDSTVLDDRAIPDSADPNDRAIPDSTGSNYSAFPYDSLEFQGHHYYIFPGSEKSWKEAVANCNDHGGYMAVIDNAEENEALYNYMIARGFDQAFFGLTRTPDGSWDYLSYSNNSSEFRDWGYNSRGEPEPNNADNGEKYAELDVNMSNGHWNDAEFGGDTHTPDGDKYKDTSAYICEWDF